MKRIFTKEKIDRQLVGQSSSMSFMSIRDGYINKKLTFDTQDHLQEKIDKTHNDDEQINSSR